MGRGIVTLPEVRNKLTDWVGTRQTASKKVCLKLMQVSKDRTNLKEERTSSWRAVARVRHCGWLLELLDGATNFNIFERNESSL